MSELRANTLSDAAGTGPTALTGQSAAKAWGTHSSAASPSLLESFNVSSITDDGVGQTKFTVTNAMSATTTNGGFAVQHERSGTGADVAYARGAGNTASDLATASNFYGSDVDRQRSMQLFGDLA